MNSAPNSTMRYEFRPVNACNMCATPVVNAKVLGRRLNASQGFNPRRKSGICVTVAQCRHCDLIFSNPMPIPTSIEDHYGLPPEEYWKDEYFLPNPNLFAHEMSRLNRLISLQTGDRVLDIGAGIGKTLSALSRAGFDAYGIEASRPFFDRAIGKMGIAREKLSNVPLEQASFPPNFFKFISFGAVLEHLYDPSASIEKALSWLQPGGILHIEVPSSAWLVGRLLNSYYRLIGTDYVTNISPMHVPFHLYEFGSKSFAINGSRLGYQVALEENFVGQTFLPKLLDFILVPLMRASRTGMVMTVYLKKN